MVHLAYYGSKGGYRTGGGSTLHFPEAEGQEAFTYRTNYNGDMDIRNNLEAGGSEGGTGKETHGKPGRMKDSDAEVPSCLEGGQNMQGEKRGEGDLLISGKRSVERGVKQNSEMAPRIQGSLISPHH